MGGKFLVAKSIDHYAKPIQPGVVRTFLYDRIFIRPSKTEFGVIDIE